MKKLRSVAVVILAAVLMGVGLGTAISIQENTPWTMPVKGVVLHTDTL